MKKMLIGDDIRVLIVEDEPLVSEMLLNILGGMGYRVAGIATNGKQALSMTESLRPDVILMDIGLPEMDGIEATRIIQEICPTPVVILTAYDNRDTLARATEAGVGAFLTKPTNPASLKNALTTVIARFNDMMELRRLNTRLQTEIVARQQVEEERARLLEAEREQRLLAETLADVTLALTSQTRPELVLDEILDQAQRIVPFRSATIMLLDGNVLRNKRW